MANSIEQVRKEIGEMKRPFAPEVDGFRPVIVKIEYKKNKFTYGVQFWSAFLINQGWSRNSDQTVATFIEFV